MKKVFFLLAFIILISCSKSDSPEITGDWDMSFTETTDTGSIDYTGVLSVVQSGSNLTGSLELAGESKPLLTNSSIGTTTVAIYVDKYVFNGDINSKYDRMAGDLYVFDYFTGLYANKGTWLATKK